MALQRTADNKYLRLGVDDADHLLGGFPKTREELFAYRGLILGSIEAGAFTGDQLRMIADFVEKRGGGLLMLGGPRAFAEGSYTGTPVADVLPVVLERPTKTLDAGAVARLKVRPTRDGVAHAVTQLGANEQASSAIWDKLPALTSVNPLRALKPGRDDAVERRRRAPPRAGGAGRISATAAARRSRFRSRTPGSGRCTPTSPVEDMTHENYWRQLMRWLVDGVPDHVEAHTSADRVEAGETVTITADVVDPTFVEINDARAVAHVEGPKGIVDVPLQWTGERSGEYRGTFVAPDEGLYTARVEATRGDDGARHRRHAAARRARATPNTSTPA